MMKKILDYVYSLILIKIIGRSLISRYADMYQVSSSIKILENDFGHFRSIERQIPIDGNGNPLPWFTYPSIEYLNQLDLKDKMIFEWGSGNSSQYFAKRAKRLISVEDNEEWYNKNARLKLENHEIFLESGDNYIGSIGKHGLKFDVIIIDGKFRIECAKIARNYLNVGGIIILDNSDWYKNTAKYLREQNMIEVDFHGFGPINQYNWTTSFFLDRAFNFRTLNDIQPLDPIGNLPKTCD